VPAYNFAVVPTVHERDAFFAMKCRGEAYKPPAAYEDIEVPRNSAVGLIIGVTGAAVGFALVWYIWWLAILGFVTVWGTVIARSFVRQTMRIIPADEVKRTEERWLRAVSETRQIGRDDEDTPANRGLAEVLAA
jgi:cytochrome o ubiquinol oxidase subunit 1